MSAKLTSVKELQTSAECSLGFLKNSLEFLKDSLEFLKDSLEFLKVPQAQSPCG
jgi:hypothetical protein